MKLKDLFKESDSAVLVDQLIDRVFEEGLEVHFLDAKDLDYLEETMSSFYDPEEGYNNEVDSFYVEFNSALKKVWESKEGANNILVVPIAYYMYDIPFMGSLGEDVLYYVDSEGLHIIHEIFEEEAEDLMKVLSGEIIDESMRFDTYEFDNLIDHISDNNLKAVEVSERSLNRMADDVEEFVNDEGMYDTQGNFWHDLYDAFVESSIEDIEGTNNKIILFYSNDYMNIESFVSTIGEDTLWTYDKAKGFEENSPVSYEQLEAIKEVGGMLDESITEGKTVDDYIDRIVDNNLIYIPLPDDIYMPQKVSGYLEREAINRGIDVDKTFTIITPTAEKGYDVRGNKADWFYLIFPNSDLYRIQGDAEVIMQDLIDAGSDKLNEVFNQRYISLDMAVDKIADDNWVYVPWQGNTNATIALMNQLSEKDGVYSAEFDPEHNYIIIIWLTKNGFKQSGIENATEEDFNFLVDVGSINLNEVYTEDSDKYAEIIDKIVEGDYEFNPVGEDYPKWGRVKIIEHLVSDSKSTGKSQFTYVKYQYENSKNTGVYPYLFHFDDDTTIIIRLTDEGLREILEISKSSINEVSSEDQIKWEELIDVLADGGYKLVGPSTDENRSVEEFRYYIEKYKGQQLFTYSEIVRGDQKSLQIFLTTAPGEMSIERFYIHNTTEQDIEDLQSIGTLEESKETLSEITYDSIDTIVDKIVEEGWVFMPWPTPGGYPLNKGNMSKRLRVETNSNTKRVFSATRRVFRNAEGTEETPEIEILWSSLEKDSELGPGYTRIEVDYFENGTEEDLQDIIDSADRLSENISESLNESRYSDFDTLLDKVVDEGWVRLSIGGGVDKWSLDEINQYLSWKGTKDGEKYFYMRIGDTDGVFFFPNENPVFVDNLTDDDLRELIRAVNIKEDTDIIKESRDGDVEVLIDKVAEEGWVYVPFEKDDSSSVTDVKQAYEILKREAVNHPSGVFSIVSDRVFTVLFVKVEGYAGKEPLIDLKIEYVEYPTEQDKEDLIQASALNEATTLNEELMLSGLNPSHNAYFDNLVDVIVEKNATYVELTNEMLSNIDELYIVSSEDEADDYLLECLNKLSEDIEGITYTIVFGYIWSQDMALSVEGLNQDQIDTLVNLGKGEFMMEGVDDSAHLKVVKLVDMIVDEDLVYYELSDSEMSRLSSMADRIKNREENTHESDIEKEIQKILKEKRLKTGEKYYVVINLSEIYGEIPDMRFGLSYYANPNNYMYLDEYLLNFLNDADPFRYRRFKKCRREGHLK